MAPELVTMDHVEGLPLKTMKSDIYAFGHVMLEVRHVLANRFIEYDFIHCRY